MATIKRFEDLEVWQESRLLSSRIYTLTYKGSLSKDYPLKDQIRRSGGSIMDNIAEGFERSGNKEFIQFLYIAKGFLGEVRSQLFRIRDNNYIDKETFQSLYDDCIKLSRSINKLIQHIRDSNFKGSKFKDR